MRAEISRALLTRRFTLAVGVMLACFLAFSIPTWISQQPWQPEERSSAFMQAIGPIFFGGFSLLFPFCAALPCSLNQVDEIETGSLELQGIRSSVRRYVARKAVAAFISGGLAMSTAFLLHTLLWNMIALPSSPATNPCHEVAFAQGVLYADWYGIAYGLPAYLYWSVAIFLCGGLWAMIGLATAAWIPDRIVVMTVPVGIYYLWTYGLFYYALGWRIPHPSALFNDGLTASKLLSALLTDATVLLAAVVVYFIGIRRRFRHELAA